jgi:hypothetical protein
VRSPLGPWARELVTAHSSLSDKQSSTAAVGVQLRKRRLDAKSTVHRLQRSSTVVQITCTITMDPTNANAAKNSKNLWMPILHTAYRLVDLQNKDLNGAMGKPVGLSADKSRMILRLESLDTTGREIQVKPENLEPGSSMNRGEIKIGSRVALVGLKTTGAALLGMTGTVTGQSEGGRWEVHLPDGRQILVKPENLQVCLRFLIHIDI